MDLETENRIAAILLKEAAELRRQAEKEGMCGYLQKPTLRGRPNSRFLTATVHGVQQANRAVEVNEMWRARQKELELEDRLRGRSKHENSIFRNQRDIDNSPCSSRMSKRRAIDDKKANTSCLLSKMVSENRSSTEDEGLKDEEIEEFLHSRVKRGRGAVGSRMDETGPYLPPCSDYKEKPSSSLDTRERGVVFGPEKPYSLKPSESSEEELDEDKQKTTKKLYSSSSDKRHSRKHKSKAKSKDKKKRKEKKRSKH